MILCEVDNMRGSGQELKLAELIDTHVKQERFIFVEIGVWSGLTAQYLLERFPGVEYWGVDPYEAFYNANQDQCDDALGLAIARLSHYPNAHLKLATSEQSVCRFASRMIDAVFIDGDHHYEACLQDMQLWWPKTNCFMAGHDYTNAGVAKATAEFCEQHNLILYTGDSKMWWLVREGF